MNNWNISRRTFLRGAAGAAVSLPCDMTNIGAALLGDEYPLQVGDTVDRVPVERRARVAFVLA